MELKELMKILRKSIRTVKKQSFSKIIINKQA